MVESAAGLSLSPCLQARALSNIKCSFFFFFLLYLNGGISCFYLMAKVQAINKLTSFFAVVLWMMLLSKTMLFFIQSILPMCLYTANVSFLGLPFRHFVVFLFKPWLEATEVSILEIKIFLEYHNSMKYHTRSFCAKPKTHFPKCLCDGN